MDFERFKSDFIKILPAVIAALVILGAVLGYGFYKKWQGSLARPSNLPVPTGIAPLNPDFLPEPTGVPPLEPHELPEPADAPSS